MLDVEERILGVSDGVRVSVSSGVSVFEGVGRTEPLLELVYVFEILIDGVIELEYDGELLMDGCAPIVILGVRVAVLDNVIDDVREERIVREFVGVPVVFGVTEGVVEAAGHDKLA